MSKSRLHTQQRPSIILIAQRLIDNDGTCRPLLKINACMPLTSAIPSRHVITFYDCLLNGLKVEPDMGNKHYAVVLNEAFKKGGKQAAHLPLQDEEISVLVPDSDDDDPLIAPVPIDAPPPAKARPPQAGASVTLWGCELRRSIAWMSSRWRG